MSCLLAVTTDLPAFKAVRTNSSAGVNPPISSITMSMSEWRIACEVFCPDYIARYPRLLFALDVAVADVRQAQQGIAAFTENLGHGAAYRSETYEGNAWSRCFRPGNRKPSRRLI
jgi:hypothetical protein